jgi:guanylate kinase
LELTYADKFDVRLVNDNLDVAKAEAMKLVNDFLAE